MSRPIFRASLLFLTAMMILSAMITITTSGEDGLSENGTFSPTRGEVYYFEGEYPLAPSYNEEEMLLVVFLQNVDRVTVNGEGVSGPREEEFNAGWVANSLTVKNDGLVHSTGPRKRGLVEMFSATSCVFCPAPEGTLHRWIENSQLFPQKVSVIEWHILDDVYQNSFSRGRRSFYGVEATPTTMFDGRRALVGGDSSPSSKEIDNWYLGVLNDIDSFVPQVVINGRTTNNDTAGTFNVSVEVTGALPKGNWTLNVAICEDLYPLQHDGAYVRFVGRHMASRSLPQLREGTPDIVIDEENTFQDVTGSLEGNLTIHWSAYDEEDGSDLSIDLMYKPWGQAWEYIAQNLDNTGSYRWDTYNPRIPDGERYLLRAEAKDPDGKRTAYMGNRYFTIDNPDLPVFDLIQPAEGEEIAGGYTITWDASDDEDEYTALKMSIAISDDGGITWNQVTRDPNTASDFVSNDNSFYLNTAKKNLMGEPIYPDGDQYMLRFILKDTDGMVVQTLSPVFSVYNNDRPLATLSSPSDGELVSVSFDVAWHAIDQEDGPQDLYGNISVIKQGGGMKVLWEGYLMESSGEESFDTDSLWGDGQYTLYFKVTDSRGLVSESDTVIFNIYDPDPPEISDMTGPEDHARDTVTFTWNGEDPDAGETITYTLLLREQGGEWMPLVEGLEASEYSLDTTEYPDGTYELKVIGTDSSEQALTAEVIFGPFSIDNPDRPRVQILSPEGDMTYNTTMEVAWLGTDEDEDDLVYHVYYRRKNDAVWTRLTKEAGVTGSSLMWNFSSLREDDYMLKVEVVEVSNDTLSGEAVVGPFRLRIWTPPENGGGGGQPGGGDEKEESSGSDVLITSLIVVGMIGLGLIIIAVLFLFLSRARTGGPKMSFPEEDVDLSIPDIGRERSSLGTAASSRQLQPVMGYQGPPQGQVTQQMMPPVRQGALPPAGQAYPPGGSTTEGAVPSGTDQTPPRPQGASPEDTMEYPTSSVSWQDTPEQDGFQKESPTPPGEGMEQQEPPQPPEGPVEGSITSSGDELGLQEPPRTPEADPGQKETPAEENNGAGEGDEKGEEGTSAIPPPPPPPGEQ